MKLLLISNSTMPGESYLDYPKYEIQKFLGKKPVTAVFIPYAAVTFSFDIYCEKVEERFSEIGHHVIGIHTFKDPIKAIEEAEAIVVGGGNTWQLVRMLHDQKLMQAIREKALNGTPYIGWSAGSNIACPTLRTTNDMPIVEPENFNALNLIPFQINPHYTEATIPDHGGESRQMRIEEFITVNQDTKVVGLPEGSLLRIENEKMTYFGQGKCKLFAYGADQQTFHDGQDMSWLLGKE